MLVAAGLTACATAPVPAPPGQERLVGRLLLQVQGQPQRSFGADFELAGSERSGELLLSGPLGSTAARASWGPQGAQMRTADGQVHAAQDLQALATQAFGEAIPMAALFDWLRARPWPAAAWQPRPDGQAGFEQLGWLVSLTRQSEGWIEAQRVTPAPIVTVRVRLLAD